MLPHEGCAGLVFQFVHVLVGTVLRHVEQQFAGKGIAVGVQAVRRQADQHIARLNLVAGDDRVAIDDADDESGKVVFAIA